MMRAFLLLGIALLAPVIAAAATPTPRVSPPSAMTPANRLAGVAPADAYFGPFGMSPISIRTTIGFLGRQYHYRTISDHDLLRKALMTEDALRKWRAQYPADPWLAPTFFHLEQLYQAVQSEEARKHAKAILADIVRNYPDKKEGRLSRLRIAAGFPPLVAETPLVANPPTGTVTDSTSPEPAGLPTSAGSSAAGSSSAGSSSAESSSAGSSNAIPAPVPSASPR